MEEKNIPKRTDKVILTASDIVREYDIPLPAVYTIFKSPDLPVQRFTKPYLVKRDKFEEFFDVSHDELGIL